jgi:hypothetical protein
LNTRLQHLYLLALSAFLALAVALVKQSPNAAESPKEDEWLRTRALRAGDTIMFVAPSGPIDEKKVTA